MVENIGNHLINTQKFIRDRAVKNFGQADPEFGRKLQAHLDSVSNVSKINVVLVGTVYRSCGDGVYVVFYTVQY